ncbi:MAG: carboxypeptidase-like regulatory domain-containing protein [Calditrichaeota bacterium]|nr:carboxypeptidase-like regulatory domain-containing protein [Calditrichota bacterium]
MSRFRVLLALCLFAVGQARILAQEVRIRGTVRDGRTGEALPLANIWIEGTYRGTTSNAHGHYSLLITHVPATVEVRYIGYHSQRVIVTATTPEVVDVYLLPAVVELPPVVVTGEDPAVAIMREVIRRKQQWRSKLRTFAAEAYSRFSVSNDTAMVMILESTSRLFWDGVRGSREVVTSRAQTSNVPKEVMIFAFGFPNFYDDDVEVLGNKFIGVTSPEALDHYQFVLLGRRGMDKGVIYDIAVSPKSQLQPCFSGTLAVLDSVYALIGAEVQPGNGVQLPFPVEEWRVQLRQHFHSFGQEFWLPVDMQEHGEVRVGVPGLRFPTIRYDRLARLTDYQVNVALPDSLYATRRVVSLDSLAVQQDTLLARGVRAVPLTEPELVAYKQVDSTWTLAQQFRPQGPLARLLKASIKVESREGSERSEPAEGKTSRQKRNRGSVLPDLRYNRVDGLHLGAVYQLRPAKGWQVQGGGGYKTGARQWSYQLALVAPAGKNSQAWVRHLRDTVPRPAGSLYPRVFNSVVNLLGAEDHFDYFWLTGTSIGLTHRVRRWDLGVEAAVAAERHSSASKQTDFALLSQGRHQRPNPPVDEGRLGSVRLKLTVGGLGSAWSVTSQKGLQIEVERSVRGLLGSDFSFTSYRAEATYATSTFVRRRLLPNRLDLRLVAGMIEGLPPRQRLGTIEGRLAFLSPFGGLRTLEGWYEGKKYLGLFWEHNFRTVPFELLGLHWLVDQGVGLVMHGGVARTWRSDVSLPEVGGYFSAGFHQELGLSLSGLLGFLRCDVTRRLDRSAWAVALSLARLY